MLKKVFFLVFLLSSSSSALFERIKPTDNLGLLFALYLQGNWFSNRLTPLFEPTRCPGLGEKRGFQLPNPLKSQTSTLTSSHSNKELRRSNKPLPSLSIPLHDPEDIRFLGKGHFGEIFLAKSKRAEFVFKIIETSSKSLDQNPLLEAEILYTLEGNPHIPHFLGSDVENDQVQIAMTRAPGRTLNTFAPSLAQIRQIMRQLLETLQYAHERGVAHLDIKPANLMWDNKTRHLTIIDWGISRFFDIENPFIDDMPDGTILYRNPFATLNNAVYVDIYTAGKTCEQFLSYQHDVPQEAEDFIVQCLRGKPIEELLKHRFFTAT